MAISEKWTRENIAWAAGLFEGEGSISSPRKQSAQMALSMTDEDVVRKFGAIIGLGNVSGPHQDKRKPHYKPMWRWGVGGSAKVQAVLAVLWPFLGSRRQSKAEQTIRECAARAPHGKYKKRCKYGHELSGDNLYSWGGVRQCRTCRNAVAKEHHRIKRGYYERRGLPSL